MNNTFKAKLLQRLLQRKDDKGFTLIELLVVVIIVGVLAAIALPNLLGQVGKAREVEGKNGIGTINRAQQAYHFEKFNPDLDIGFATGTDISDPSNELGVIVVSDYYSFNITGDETDSTVLAPPEDADNDRVRSYAGAVAYDAGSYDSAICQSNDIGGDVEATSASGQAGCTGDGTEIEGSN